MTPAEAAAHSLLGLSIGDAIGSAVERSARDLERWRTSRALPDARPWRWTDDTAMAVSIVELLRRLGALDADELAAAYVRRFAEEPNRGYGAAAYALLMRVSMGAPWREEAARLFGGKGSLGNGAAMRAAPVGAFFADDLERVRREATIAAQPTHAHPDGVAGAVAVAVAAALALSRAVQPDRMLAEIARWTPEGPTREGLLRAAELPLANDVEQVGSLLGTGSRVTASDTVPFAAWVAVRHLDSFADAVWAATAVDGVDLAKDRDAVFAVDRDTLGAIVGGIVVCATGVDGVPSGWRDGTEPLPAM